MEKLILTVDNDKAKLSANVWKQEDGTFTVSTFWNGNGDEIFDFDCAIKARDKAVEYCTCEVEIFGIDC